MVPGLTKLSGMAVIFLTVMLVQISAVSAGENTRSSGPLIELPTVANKCIRPTEFMRKNHMDLLQHKRDQTTRQGIRTKDASLQGCVDCHTKNDEKGTPIPIDAQGQFCSTCHEYVAVKLDCFECHRTTPDVPDQAASIPVIPAHTNLLAKLLAKPLATKLNEVDSLRTYLEEAN